MRFYVPVVLLVLMSLEVFAQDYSLEVSYGKIELAAGFEADPHTVALYAGGNIDLSESEEFNCTGFVGEAPDYKVDYSKDGESYTLSFYAPSEIDTVLLINDPNGAWHCNDDYDEQYGFMAGLEFESPLEGVYDIWVGVYDQEDKYAAAEFIVTELGYLLDEDEEGAGTPSESNLSDTPQNIGSGTAFLISDSGHLLTNHHVIAECASLTFQLPGEPAIEASVVTSNLNFDLALLKTNLSISPAEFRTQNRLRLGDEIVVYGFPLLGNLSSQGNITSGVVSALTGLDDDLSTFQISAQIQPGNSGGPVFSRDGRVVGVVVSMANEEYFSQQSGASPQNINFAITANISQSFLDSNNIDYVQTNDSEELSIADIAEMAQTFTGSILCFK
jgi:S1-C subfamily serine protease